MELDPEIETALKRLTETTTLRETTLKPNGSELSASSSWRTTFLKWSDCNSPILRKAATGAESLVKRFQIRKTSPFSLLVLIGRSGCGKTHLAKASVRAANRLAMTGWEQRHWKTHVPSAVFCDWPAFVDSDADGVSKDLQDADFAALDDVGAEVDQYKSGKPAEILRRFLSLRAGKFTIVTTNVPESAWNQKWDERVADRLYRNSLVVDMTSASSYATCKIPSSILP